MSTETVVLRALLRLARRRNPATLEDLLSSLSTVPVDVREVQHALASLARAQLILRSGNTARLSLAGLAVALAATANAKQERQQRAKTLSQSPRARPTARIFPMQPRARVRGHRAA